MPPSVTYRKRSWIALPAYALSGTDRSTHFCSAKPVLRPSIAGRPALSLLKACPSTVPPSGVQAVPSSDASM